MASALQKLFKKRIGKQDQQQQTQQHGSAKRKSQAAGVTGLGQRSSNTRDESRLEQRQSYFTVGGLNSPSPVPNNPRASMSSGFMSPSSASTYDIARYSSEMSEPHGRSRSNSVGAEALLRQDSASSRMMRSSGLYDASFAFHVDQFGNLPGSSCSSQVGLASTSENGECGTSRPPSDDEDDILQNSLYNALFSEISLKASLRHAELVLLPDKESLRTLVDSPLLRNPRYLALHVLSPSSLFKGQFIAPLETNSKDADAQQFRITATLHPEVRSVAVLLTRNAGPRKRPIHNERKLRVESETTTYHSFLNSATKRKDRIRMRVLTVRGLVVSPSLFQRRPSAPPEDGDLSLGDMGADTSSVSFPASSEHGKIAADASLAASESSSLALRRLQETVPHTRQFTSDFLLMLQPDVLLEPIRPALTTALTTIEKAADEFVKAYVYVPGFDTYNVSRVRRGILAKAWQAFEDARNSGGIESSEFAKAVGSSCMQRLLCLFENVVMGFCHAKVYGSILEIMRDQDCRFDTLLNRYKDANVNIKDLDVSQNPSASTLKRLETVTVMLSYLGEAEEDLQDVIQSRDPESLRLLVVESSWHNIAPLSATFMREQQSPLQRRRTIRTPLDVLDLMLAVLEQLAGCSDTPQTEQPTRDPLLSTDALLPLLASALVKSSPSKFLSTLYYTKLFGVSDATSSRHNWALTTFETALEFLKGDPLKLCTDLHDLQAAIERSSASIHSRASSSRSKSSYVSSSFAVRSSEGRALHPSRDRLISLPARSPLGATSHSDTEANEVRSEVRSDGTEATCESLAGFKMPGTPASASGTSRLSPRPGSIVSERSSISGGQCRSPPPAGHRKSPSMTSDIKIRPQIVVRSTAKGAGHGLARSGTLERTISESDASSSKSGDYQDGSTKIVASSHHTPPLELRRKSLDSWAAMSLYSALNLGSPSDKGFADQRSFSAAGREVSAGRPSSFRGEVTSSGQSPSPSRGDSLRPDRWGIRDPRIDAADTPDLARRRNQSQSPISRTGENVLLSPMALPVSASGRSIGGTCIGSLDSMPSLEAHETSTEGHGESLTGSPRELASPIFSRSYSTSPSSDLRLRASPTSMMAKSCVDASIHEMEKRRRRQSRSRLLSITKPGDVSPSKWTADAASALATPTNVERMWTDVDKGISADVTPRQSWLPSAVNANLTEAACGESSADMTQETIVDHGSSDAHDPPAIHFGRFLDPQGLHRNASASLARPPSLRLHIPTPVEEIGDPMSFHTGKRLT